MIELKNVKKQYNDNVVFENLNINFENKQITAIMGESGCGKTTLLNMLAGLTDFDGTIKKDYDNVSFVFNDNSIYVAFRGTDSTLVGWKEDLNMGFMDVIPSQIDAVNYLRQIINHFSDYKIFVGGHSKGGNLAVYSAIFIDEALQNIRVLKILLEK